MCSRNVSHTLILADSDPRGPAQFAGFVDHGSSVEMPKSRYDVPQRLMKYNTERHAESAIGGKVDGILTEHHQVAGACRLVRSYQDL